LSQDVSLSPAFAENGHVEAVGLNGGRCDGFDAVLATYNVPSDNKQIDLRRSIVDFRRALCLISLGADANVKLGPICLWRRRWTKMYVLKIGTRLLHPHTQQSGHFFGPTRLDFTHASMSPLSRQTHILRSARWLTCLQRRRLSRPA
jgi:hypothetical protein